MEEVERKFLVARLPQLPANKVEYERYYLYADRGIELRIQRKNNAFELERKLTESELSRTADKIKISRDEFELLKSLASTAIIRDGYDLGGGVSVKIYHGQFEGLTRAEVEFESEEDAAKFVPLSWFGKEITGSPLGRDRGLLQLPLDEFRRELEKQQSQ